MIHKMIFLSFLPLISAWAENAPDALSPTSRPAVSESTGTIDKSKKKKKAKRVEQKENEGTQAKGRFEADTILKSEYQLNGQPLEVDPD